MLVDPQDSCGQTGTPVSFSVDGSGAHGILGALSTLRPQFFTSSGDRPLGCYLCGDGSLQRPFSASLPCVLKHFNPTIASAAPIWRLFVGSFTAETGDGVAWMSETLSLLRPAELELCHGDAGADRPLPPVGRPKPYCPYGWRPRGATAAAHGRTAACAKSASTSISPQALKAARERHSQH